MKKKLEIAFWLFCVILSVAFILFGQDKQTIPNLQPDPISVKEIADSCANQSKDMIADEISKRIILQVENNQLRSLNTKQATRIKELEAKIASLEKK